MEKLHRSPMFHSGLKKLSEVKSLFFNSDFDYAIRKVQENVVGLKLNGTQLLVM
jgi:hypothetical protein